MAILHCRRVVYVMNIYVLFFSLLYILYLIFIFTVPISEKNKNSRETIEDLFC